MNDVERLLRQAQQWQAEHGPDVDRIRRALPALRTRRTRRRRAGFAALALVAVLLIAAPALLWPRGEQPDHPGGRPHLTPPAPSSVAPTGIDPDRIPLGYAPTWLPGGLHERFRGVTRTATGDLRIQRAWTAHHVGTAGGLPHQAVTVTVQQARNPRDPAESAAQTVEINGVLAAYARDTDRAGATVSWLADARHIVEVHTDISMSRTDLLRIARSMQVDTAYTLPLRLRWAPADRPDVSYELSGDSGTAWNATVVLTNPDRPDARVTITLAPGTVAPRDGDEVVNVGGRPAQLSTSPGPDGKPMLSLVQQQDNSPYLLTISCQAGTPVTPTKDDLIRLAEQTASPDAFSPDWLD
jgi:hypothetical protein